jgi:hypothetical protein
VLLSGYKWALQLSSASILNISVLFLFQIIAIANIGIGEESDVYFAAVIIPQFISLIFSILIINRTLPILSGASSDDQHLFILGLSSLLFLISALILFLLFLASDFILSNVFEEIFKSSSIKFKSAFLISLFFIPFNLMVAAWTALEYSRDQYLKVELLSMISTLIPLIIILALGNKLNLFSFLYISLIRFFLLYIFLTKHNFYKIFYLKSFKKHLDIFLGSKSYSINLAMTKSDQVVDRILISSAGNLGGTLTIFSLAYQFIMIMASIISKTFGNRTLKSFSISRNREYELNSKLRLYLLEVIGCLVVIELLLILFGRTALKVVLYQLGYDEFSVDGIYSFMVLLSGLLIGGSIRQIIENLFHASFFSFQFSVISSFVYIFFLIAKIFAFFHYSIVGLCIVISAYSILDPIILYIIYSLKKSYWHKNESSSY